MPEQRSPLPPTGTVLATRLNDEPPIFRGCASSELLAILLVAIAVWLPAGFLLGALIGIGTMGLGFAVFGALGTVLLATRAFERLKRGRPPRYFRLRFVLWLEDRGLKSPVHIRRSGVWDLGRRLPRRGR